MKLLDLEAEFDRLCSEPSDINQHLPTFVDLVDELNASHVIELGTRTGVSTIAWLWALTGTEGRLTSIDIDERPDIGTFDHWTFIQGDDLDPDIVAGLEPADIVFIDTSHLYDQTLRELNLYRWLVKPGGVMVLHDTELERPIGAPIHPRFPVKRAVLEFCKANGFAPLFVPYCWGLGIVRI
jgi:cephalosporin hydroxylase